MAVMYVYFKRSKPMSVVDCNSTSAADSGTKFLEIYAKIRNALQCWVYLIPKQFKIKNVRPDICLAERVSSEIQMYWTLFISQYTMELY